MCVLRLIILAFLKQILRTWNYAVANLGKMPWPGAAKPTLQELVPLRDVPDQESKVLRARLWDPEEQANICNAF